MYPDNLGDYKTCIKATYSADSGIEGILLWLVAYVWERWEEIMAKIWALVGNVLEDKQAKDLWPPHQQWIKAPQL